MGSATDYTEAKVLDYLFGAVSFTPPATYYLALFTAAPSDAGGGTEVAGGAYARVSIINNLTNWPAASGDPTTKSNGNPITFPEATASWGTPTHFGVFDAATLGTLRFWGAITSPTAVGSGFTAFFAVGQIVITAD